MKGFITKLGVVPTCVFIPSSLSGHNKESLNEWDIMKDCDKGKACYWSGVHRHVMTSFDYNSLKHRPEVCESIFCKKINKDFCYAAITCIVKTVTKVQGLHFTLEKASLSSGFFVSMVFFSLRLTQLIGQSSV